MGIATLILTVITYTVCDLKRFNVVAKSPSLATTTFLG